MQYNALLQGKTALVTGGAQGIGQAIAMLYAQHGARVVICDVVDDQGLLTQSQLRELHPECFYVSCDTGNRQDIQRLCQEVDARFGHIDILDNNVGINIHEPITQIQQEHFERVMSVNARSAFLLCKHFLPGMVERGYGNILFTSTIHSVATIPVFGSYAASKGVINAMARALAAEYGPLGIRVNTVSPGGIRSSRWETMLQSLTKEEYRMADWSVGDPLPFIGRSIEIAQAHLFFASDMAKAITGNTLLVDSGSNAHLHAFDTFLYPDTHPVSRRMHYAGRVNKHANAHARQLDAKDDLAGKTYIHAWGGVLPKEDTPIDHATTQEDFGDLVDPQRLQKQVGKRIAEMTHNQAAYVTSGAYAGIVMAATACLSTPYNQGDSLSQTKTTTKRDQIVVMNGYAGAYDLAITSSGATMVEMPDPHASILAQVKAICSDKTCAILLVEVETLRFKGLQEIARWSHQQGIYVIVDGMEQLFPKSNLWFPTRDCGADLILFHQEQGNQKLGLALGKQRLIDAFFAPSSCDLEQAGVPPLSREAILGVYSSMMEYLAVMPIEDLATYYDESCRYIAQTLRNSGFFTCEIVDAQGQNIPWVCATILSPVLLRPEALQTHLKACEYGVIVGTTKDAITISPLCLEPGQIDIILHQIISVCQDPLGGQ